MAFHMKPIQRISNASSGKKPGRVLLGKVGDDVLQSPYVVSSSKREGKKNVHLSW